MHSKLFLILISFITLKASSQALDANNRLSIKLNDGTSVNLIGKATEMATGTSAANTNPASNEYYYMPVNLKLSKKADGTPEFLLVKYTTDKDASLGGVQGAIIHFLVEWGLNPQQIKELELKLKDKIATLPKTGSFFGQIQNVRTGEPKILGVAPLISNVGTFDIISASLSDVKMFKSGIAPTTEQSKAIVAAKLDKNVAQLFFATLDKSKSIADLSLEMRFNYTAKIPAIKGTITVDWSKIENYFQSTDFDKTSDKVFWWVKSITASQRDSMYSNMIENKFINIALDLGGNTPEEQAAVQKIGEVFMTSFTNMITTGSTSSVTQPANSLEPASDARENNTNALLAQNRASNMDIDLRKIANKAQKKIEVIKLNQRMNSTFTTTLTANIFDWYNQARDNSKCVYSVNLNDPFFDHRYINFILDLDAKDIFDNEVNYVTVNVRKKRDQGNTYQDRIVIDKKTLTERGSNYTLMYARGEDRNPDVYEYQTQWSLRGGNIFPKIPVWEKGEWVGVTLYPPVKPLNIEFEANLDMLKEMNISRVTLQIRYKKFGEEIEDNLNVSPAQGQSLVNRILYADKDTKGYVYRLVFNHVEEGKLVLPWSSKINDNYVFATIPDDLKDKTSVLFEQAKKLGKETSLKQGKIPSTETIIDTFKEIFNTVKK